MQIFIRNAAIDLNIDYLALRVLVLPEFSKKSDKIELGEIGRVR
jgi:hypothetical protein